MGKIGIVTAVCRVSSEVFVFPTFCFQPAPYVFFQFETGVAGAELLRKEGVKVRIVSAPSEGLFRNQSKEYQESILPAGAKIFGLTAGLPVNLEGLVGSNGKVFGLESFGFSAPYKVLDEKLGFTAENVYNQVKAML